MKVFTFHSHVPELNASEQFKMIAIWMECWARHGWEPVVLSQRDIEESEQFDMIAAEFRRRPTVNPIGYEMACWLRWFAMANVGGLMVDYDVLNFGFTPADIPANDGQLASILCDNNPCPCAVHGTTEQYSNTVQLLLNYQLTERDQHGGRPHISDQNVIQAEHAKFRPFIFDICREFNSPDWHTRKLVHFCHAATHGRDRLELMRHAAKSPLPLLPF